MPSKFPENWRDELAGADKTLRSQLERFASPQAFAESWRHQQLRISSGELKEPAKPLPANATPEQVTAWRKEQGLPDNAAAFVTNAKLANGMVPGADDKPLLDAFAEHAVKQGWTQDQFNANAAWYYEMQGRAAAAQAEADAAFHQTAVAELTQEWGGPQNFKANQNAIASLLDAYFPADAKIETASGAMSLKDAFLNARLPDGTVLGNNPAVLRGLVAAGREMNPIATLTGMSGADAAPALAKEKADIEKLMGDQASAYWRGPQAQQMQARYREIIDAEEKMKGRKAA